MVNRFVEFRTIDDCRFLVDITAPVSISEAFETNGLVFNQTTGEYARKSYVVVNGNVITSSYDEVFRVFGTMQLPEGCSCK